MEIPLNAAFVAQFYCTIARCDHCERFSLYEMDGYYILETTCFGCARRDDCGRHKILNGLRAFSDKESAVQYLSDVGVDVDDPWRTKDHYLIPYDSE